MLNFLKSLLPTRQAKPAPAAHSLPDHHSAALLLPTEQLGEYARRLAATHRLAQGGQRGRPLLRHLSQAAAHLNSVHTALAHDADAAQATVPAAEWLLDNYYIIEEQIAEVQVDLPERYYRQLPKLAAGEYAGYPRIYALSQALLMASDGLLDYERIVTFVRGYQEAGHELTIGELWSVAIMLRLSLVERLSELASEMLAIRQQWQAADSIARDILKLIGRNPATPIALPPGLSSITTTLGPVFATRLQRLREQGEAARPVLDWLEQHLAAQGTTTAEMVQREVLLLTSLQELVGNIVTSMRRLSALDWASFVEDLSVTEAALRRDPAGVYPQMDFATRDRYRHAVEQLARHSRYSEPQVAEQAIMLTGRAPSPPADLADPSAVHAEAAAQHVGYYLVDGGRPQLAQMIGYQPPLLEQVASSVETHPHRYYLGALTAVTGGLVGVAATYAARHDGKRGTIAAAALAALPASSLASSLVNHLITSIIKPRVLPRLELKQGIPSDLTTMVVVPVLLNSVDGVQELLEHLEILALANPDPNLHFAILSDFADADAAELPEDGDLLHRIITGINDLKVRYRSGGRRFYLFHRDRKWNAVEGKWMGWERKRGKLTEFNHLLTSGDQSAFALIIGDLDLLPQIRFVITLDADTELPPGASLRLVGTIAHPLNRPIFDPHTNRVVRGYGILQPRVETTLISGNASLFARLSSGHTGVDPYTTAVSDVYQDLFGEGIFMGKGIYDVQAFSRAMQGRFPENRLLSHDLIEGLYARTALVTDITLYDDQPSRYLVAARRAHRWVRGDWQILPWLFPRVPDAQGNMVPNVLPLAARWKIFDNLRRSLEAPALLAMLVAGWTVLPGRAVAWTALATFVRAFPTAATLLFTIPRRPPATPWPRHLNFVLRETGLNLAHLAMTTTMLPDQAAQNLDAITRTLARLCFTHRNLLEWQTAAATQRMLGNHLSDYLRAMWRAPLFATVLLGAMLRQQRARASRAYVAAPYLAAWAASPFVAYRLSQPSPPPQQELALADLLYLRRAARKTWRYFATFIGPDDHWLPPDNYQEDPQPMIAHRTSPTNMSLALLASLAARDFGYLTCPAMVERLELQLSSMEDLERYRGHFYNWYDTQTLKPLLPAYISSVDSGNLAGHLLVLKQGCLERIDHPIADRAWLDGLADTLSLLAEAIAASKPASPLPPNVAPAIQNLSYKLQNPVLTLPAWSPLLDDVACDAAALNETVASLPTPKLLAADPAAEVRYWAEQLSETANAAASELQALLPYLAHLQSVPPALTDGSSPALAALWQELPLPPADLSLGSNIAWCADALPRLRLLRQAITRRRLPREVSAPPLKWLAEFTAAVAAAWTACEQLTTHLRDLARRCEALVEMMRFDFLFDEQRGLFVIGYNVTEQRRDTSHYDLLASEARFTSFFAIARDEVPTSHWFKLGRARTPACDGYALLSWAGTMFEYLMPNLVMRSYPNSLIAASNQAAVCRQQQYGRERGVPWGISESAYGVRYHDQNYQYRAFGVPGLGLKRGLSNNLVVAPYATMLALLVDPAAATANLRRLAPVADARYGFYDAVDYTASRLPVNRNYLPVRSYMAHHQGMSLLALDDAVHGNPMVARFHNEPQVQAVELLLQERIPLEAPITQPRGTEVEAIRSLRRPPQTAAPAQGVQHFDSAATPVPEAHLLSNGRYHVMLTNSGGGYSQWQDTAVTRWRFDPTGDNWGSFFYIRDLRSGKFWSSAMNPTGVAAQGYGATFALDEVAYWRRDDGIETRTLVVVSPDDAEVRQLTLTNYSSRPREMEVTSYAEVALAAPATDAAHPAFSKLFIETERVANTPALLASRRPRAADEQRIWLAHTLAVEGDVRGELEYETDRARFIGRGRTIAAPAALSDAAPLSGASGAVLDPILSLRRRVRLAPGQHATFTYTTAICPSRDEATVLARHYATPAAGERARRLAATHNALRRQQHDLSVERAMLYQRLASRIIYPDPALRPDPELLARNQRGQSSLWAYGISGDYPIVLLRIRDLRESDLLGELLRAHEYLTSLGLQTDLAVLNEYDMGYQQPLNDQLLNHILNSTEAEVYNQRGGVFLLRADNMAVEDRVLLLTVAHVVLLGGAGSLGEQVARSRPRPPLPDAFLPQQSNANGNTANPDPANLQSTIRNLQFFNGRGGFSADGSEYVIQLGPGENTPAPWSNIIANPEFGCLVTELGAGTTWAQNSRENRLTPWHNDPVSDPPAEAIYLRDDGDGTIWSATPLPMRQPVAYQVRHGQGYSIYQHTSHDIEHELTISVPPDAPFKRSQLRLRNLSDQSRRLTITYYAEWVMGVTREDSSRYVISEWDAAAGVLFAHNPYNNEFAANIAFVASDQPVTSYTADRREFLGRGGRLARPAALRRVALGGRLGAGLDPCAALQISVELPPGAEQTISFLLGEAKDRDAARELIGRAHQPPTEQSIWRDTMTRLTVETPDAAMNLLLNRWLPYQTLACRLWARSAFYQGGGAYGFRDQLQDVMAMVYAAPELAREQIVRAAGHQFRAGDVQHWWHPPTGRGVRTRISDDMLWLPFVTAFYVEATADWAVLDEVIPFLEAPELKPEQEDAYQFPTVSDERASLYQHCVRAIERGATAGPHGLPLMGTGDWNDGMNRVGVGGKGESVWLAWFLASVLDRFGAVAEHCGDPARADWCRRRRVELVNNIEQSAWDGEWYLRAWFDDGTPLGSIKDEECQIDAIAQSWSVISGWGEPTRQRQALAALNQRLIRDQEQLLLLLAPPFDKGKLDPGYIKGYPPGVRENGGQYTHAACWTAFAFALQGDGQRAYELFSMLNPINHALDPAGRERYKVEPYVVAADVYSHPDHIGRGGWTWYTGSAAWLYRLGLEAILGFRLHGDHFSVTPTLPPAWPGYKLTYRYKSSSYTIIVQRGSSGASLDGQPLADGRVPLRDDGREHQVAVGYEG